MNKYTKFKQRWEHRNKLRGNISALYSTIT